MLIVRFKDIAYEPASHEDRTSPGVYKKVMLTTSHFIEGSARMLNWALLPPGKSFQPHYHEDMQEIFTLVTGQARMVVDGREVWMEPGDTVAVPPGSVHTMENRTDDTVTYLVIGISRDEGGRTVTIGQEPGR